MAKRPREPVDWQERHSPTEAVDVVLANFPRRVTERCRRRILDARLWDALDDKQQIAAERIAIGFELTTKGLGARVQAYAPPEDRKHGGESEHQAILQRDYWQWAEAAVRERIDHAAIIGVLVDGISLRDMDRRRKRRRDYTRGHLVEGLNLYSRGHM